MIHHKGTKGTKKARWTNSLTTQRSIWRDAAAQLECAPHRTGLTAQTAVAKEQRR